MGGEKRDVVGVRPFYFDGQVRKITALEFRTFPSDRGKIGRRRKQLLRNCFAPFVDQSKPFSADGNEPLSAIPYCWATPSALHQSRRARQ